MLVRRWTRAWIPGLVLVLLPVACKQEPTDPFGSSRTKDPAGHPVLGVESVPLNASAFAVAINRDGVYYVTTVFGPVVRGVLPSTDLSIQLQSGILATGISNDGQTLYSLTDYHGIDIISTSTLQITENIPASSVGSLLTGIAFHPTQPLMYVAARDAGVVTVVQIPANTVLTTLAVPGGRIQNVAISRDGTQLFATDIQRSKLIVWDLTNENAPFQEVAIGSGLVRNAFDVAETPDGVQLYVSALADGNIYVLDRKSLSLVATLTVGGSPRYIAFNASGTHAIIPNEYGWVTFVHDVPPPPPSACNTPQTGPAPTDKTHPSLESKDSQPLSAQPFAVAISRNNVVYITQGWNASAVRADLPSTALSAPFPVGALPSQVRISPDGSTAYVEDQDSHTITYIDVATNHIIGQATVPAGSILNMGLSRDGTRLYALTDYDGVYVIDVNSRAVIAQIPAAKTGL